jgi:hypothetical protein
MKIQSVIIVSFMLLVTVLACKKEKTEETPQTPSIVGTWKGGGGVFPEYILVIGSDGKYSYSSGGNTMESGSYTSTSSTVKYTSNAGSVCAVTFIGEYSYTVNETTLDFTTVSDNWSFRTSVMACLFTRQ